MTFTPGDAGPPTGEIPVFTTNEPPVQPPSGGPQYRTGRGSGKGCLWVMVVFMVLVVVIVVLGAIGIKRAVHTWRDDASPTTTTLPGQTTVLPHQVGQAEYVQLLQDNMTRLGDEARQIEESCRSSARSANCRASAEKFRDDLQAAQTQLDAVKAPPNLADIDAQVRSELNTASKGANDIVSGLDGHLVNLLKGITELGKASANLAQTQSQLQQLQNATTNA